MANIACFCSSRESTPERTFNTRWGPVTVIRCLSCSARRAADVDDDESLSELYEGTSIYRAPTAIDFAKQVASFEHVARDVARLGLQPQRVLDVGCNAGYGLIPFKRRGSEVWGIERNQETAAYARSQHGLALVTDLQSLPAGLKFDVILLSHIVEHIPDPVGFLSALAERLSNGGVIFVKVPNYGSRLVRHIIRDRWSGFLPRQHIWYFDRHSLPFLLGLASFETVRMSSRGHLGVRSQTWLKTLIKAPLAGIHRLFRLDGEELVGVFSLRVRPPARVSSTGHHAARSAQRRVSHPG